MAFGAMPLPAAAHMCTCLWLLLFPLSVLAGPLFWPVDGRAARTAYNCCCGVQLLHWLSPAHAGRLLYTSPPPPTTALQAVAAVVRATYCCARTCTPSCMALLLVRDSL